MYRSDEVLVKDICDCIDESLGIVEGMSYRDLYDDRIRQYALIRLLEIIGEAANQMSADFKDKNPEIPWKKMIAMRNRLIHGYFSVNPEIVWDTVNTDLPYLRKILSCDEL